MSAVVYLDPPKEIYSSAVVERGLIGFASHIIDPKSPEISLLRDVWGGDTLHATSAAFVLRDNSQYIANPQSHLYGNDEPFAKAYFDVPTIYDVLLPHVIIYSSSENLMGKDRFYLSLPHYPEGLSWAATLKFTKEKAYVLLSLYKNLVPVRFFSSSFGEKRASALTNSKGQGVDVIIIPFTYPDDNLDFRLLFEYAKHSQQGELFSVGKARKQGQSEVTRLARKLEALNQQLDRGPFDEPIAGTYESLTGKKLEQKIERTQLRLEVNKRALSRDLPLLAKVQAEINHLTLKRAWKAAMLGMLQAAELKFAGDQDHD